MVSRIHLQPAMWAGVLCAALVLAACGPAAEPPLPTRTPAPTFTPGPAVPPAPPVVQEQPAPPESNPAEQEGVADAVPTSVPVAAEPVAAEPPTPEPTPPPPAEVVINSAMNIRGGPGTTYNVIGSASQGQRFPTTGKNPEGNWWQIDYNGQAGWVFGDLVTTQNTEAVAVAVNIPQPPPPTPVPPQPQPQPEQPQPAPPEPAPAEPAPAEPAPPPASDPNLEFGRAVFQKCAPNAGVTYVEGTTYKNGQPVNGYNVAFSYAPDGPIVAQVVSGPHEGYPGWRTGFYSHILKPDGPREGNWFFWIVDGSGNRISAIGNVQTNGEAGDGKCQQAVIDFDS